jgi:deoxyribodipyrimidine photo-lyase
MVLFVLDPDYPEANLRHYRFMLEGLAVTARRLRERGIGFTLRIGSPVEEVLRLSEEAALLVGDRSYLRPSRAWRAELAAQVRIPYYEVESDAVVPIEAVSDKEEYTAGTLRPKLHRRLFQFLKPLSRREVTVPWTEDAAPWRERARTETADAAPKPVGDAVPAPEDIDAVLGRLEIDDSVAPVEGIVGGEDAAQELLDRFVEEKLAYFDELRNDPAQDYTSGLSPYLHYGQISPLAIALAALEHTDVPRESFLEELVVRRELSFNFTWYDEDYDSLGCLPRWARETLRVHEQDYREPSYTLEQLEAAQTHDPYWNAAQRELLYTGAMHGYMRMYWGKKILEWTPSMEDAFDRALYLNNRYALDGRDPNSYAGIAWCFGKHDRAWTERRIFGKVRYMNDRGLKRKFKIDRYVERINSLSP